MTVESRIKEKVLKSGVLSCCARCGRTPEVFAPRAGAMTIIMCLSCRGHGSFASAKNHDETMRLWHQIQLDARSAGDENYKIKKNIESQIKKYERKK